MTEAAVDTPSDFLDGSFAPLPGDDICSTNPAAPAEVLWQGSPNAEHVDEAVAAARRAFESWSATTLDQRIEVLGRWREVSTRRAEEMAQLIMREMGKTLAEARFEAKALAGKVDITLDAVSVDRVRDYEVKVSDTRDGHCRFKPHGVMAVIGPFNFPAHLPNGHFVPALLTGNTIVFKPSEKTPAVGQLIAEFMSEAEVPPGVFNMVQGAGDIAASLVDHDGVDGVLFTGSWPVGKRILEANLDRPGRIIALEMGGSNPAVVLDDAHLKQAVIECVRASFATTGQRCTCTRRVIVQRAIADEFILSFCKAASTLLVGPGDSPEPVFMGPLVTEQAVDDVLRFQDQLAAEGATVITPATTLDRPGHFVTPGVVQVERFTIDADCEVFGPIVQISVVDDLDQAIDQGNATRFGLAASIFTTNDDAYETFFRRTNAGCINRNTGTAGASGKLPFGGLGISGNHRPAGAFSVDYCAYPVANMVEQSDSVAVPEGMHWDDSWIRASVT